MWWTAIARLDDRPPAAVIALLHGFLGSPASWDEVAAHLGPGVRLLSGALPWHGNPPRRPRGSTFDEIADELVEAVPEGAWLAGYSLGGRLALRMALRHPRRFTGVALVGAHPGLEDEGERQARRVADEDKAERLEASGLSAFVAEWENEPLFASQRRLPEDVRQRQREARRGHTTEVAEALRVLGLGRMPAMWRELAVAPMPLWFVAGALDPKFAELARRAAATAPNARAVIVPDAGHNLVLEAPAALATTLEAAVHGRSDAS